MDKKVIESKYIKFQKDVNIKIGQILQNIDKRIKFLMYDKEEVDDLYVKNIRIFLKMYLNIFEKEEGIRIDIYKINFMYKDKILK